LRNCARTAATGAAADGQPASRPATAAAAGIADAASVAAVHDSDSTCGAAADVQPSAHRRTTRAPGRAAQNRLTGTMSPRTRCREAAAASSRSAPACAIDARAEQAARRREQIPTLSGRDVGSAEAWQAAAAADVLEHATSTSCASRARTRLPPDVSSARRPQHDAAPRAPRSGAQRQQQALERKNALTRESRSAQRSSGAASPSDCSMAASISALRRGHVLHGARAILVWIMSRRRLVVSRLFAGGFLSGRGAGAPHAASIAIRSRTASILRWSHGFPDSHAAS